MGECLTNRSLLLSCAWKSSPTYTHLRRPPSAATHLWKSSPTYTHLWRPPPGAACPCRPLPSTAFSWQASEKGCAFILPSHRCLIPRRCICYYLYISYCLL